MSNLNQIGLDSNKSAEIAKDLNLLLADYHIFYQNMRGLHWNIKGKQFFVLHEKFEELYDDLFEKIDDIAERILTIGEAPVHTYSDYIEMADIKEAKNISDAEGSLKVVLNNMKHVLNRQREILAAADEAGDQGTNDLMAGFIAEQEKLVWMFVSMME